MYLSVIIPTRNRATLTAALLDSLAAVDAVPFDWEVIVVDNGSTDDTAELVRVKQNDLPIQIRYVLEERPGLHEGRHRGAVEALGEYLAYLDDDMLLAPSWLQGVSMLADRKADAVVGRIVPLWEVPPPDWLTQMFTSGGFGPLGLLDLGDDSVATENFFGGNLFIPRITVFDFGGFHPDGMPKGLLQYRGDGETGLWMKMRAAGKRLWYSPHAIAYHIIPQTRMTEEYLQTRSYNQGISASFTDMRMRCGLYGVASTGWWRWLQDVKSWARRQPVVPYMRYHYRRQRSVGDAEREVARIKHEMAKAYTKGWAFHRAAIRRDPAIAEYVRRSSFLLSPRSESP